MPRRRLATSHLTDSSHSLRDAGDDADDVAGDGPSAKLRRWAILHPLVRPCWERLREKPPSPGSAPAPVPPMFPRTAPQSAGKQFVSYPSPSPFLDGPFGSRLTFALSHCRATHILQNIYKCTGFLVIARSQCSNWLNKHLLSDVSWFISAAEPKWPAVSDTTRIAL
jgi:hypothetical protein